MAAAAAPRRAGREASRAVRSTACRPRSRISCSPAAGPRAAAATPRRTTRRRRGRAGHRAAARGRCRAAGQHDDAGVRLEGGHRQPARPPSAQPLEPGADARRLERRCRGRGGPRHGRAACRHRRRRLDPHPGRLLRHRRPEAHLRAGARLAAVAVRHGRASRPDDPHRRGCGADAYRDQRARPARLARPAARGRGLPRRARAPASPGCASPPAPRSAPWS